MAEGTLQQTTPRPAHRTPALRIHAVQTGSARIRPAQRVGRGRQRQLSLLLDRDWTEWIPIHAWAIEHPEGLIVVDTGETARATRPGYYPRWHPYYGNLQIDVAPEQEIGAGLRALGLHPADARTVVLTHLHTDHAGGLHHFPDSEIVVSAEEYALARGIGGRLRGYLNWRWPRWFNPRLVTFDRAPYGPFGASVALTADGAVRLVPTPRHTPGHLSVVVRDGDLAYFLAGDASYTQALMLSGTVDGIAPDAAVARRTFETIQQFARATPTVYLPTHDPESPARLAARQTVYAGGDGGAGA
jgi:glyoxylase-like metal-dependent hydrolase (beta-lactamase superfamily II)